MIVRSPLDITGTEHDKTFVRPDTTVEVIDNSGNKTYKQVKDLNDEEKAAFENRGTSATGASKSGRTANPLQFAVDDIVSQSAPQIKVNGKGTGLVLSGTKAALDSDMGKELRKYLNDTFKYADLRSANISNAINQLNQDIRDQVEQRVAEGMYGANYDDYKEYKLTMQQFQGTNPLTSTAAVPGYTRDGKKIKATDDGARTLADWLRYYQENYSAKERADLYNRSREAIASGNKDFALWTPYLVMSGGNMSDLSSNPVYGFSVGDRALAGVEALINEGSARLIEGINQTAFDIGSGIAELIAAPGMTMRADDLKNRAKRILGTGGDITSKDIPWISENAYNEKIDSIKDKSVRALGKADKNFLAAALDSSITEDDVNNSKTVEDLLSHASYDTYISARDNLSTNEGYNKEREKIKEKGYQGRKWLQEDVDAATLYAPIETTIGSFAGTMMRMWAEAGLIKAATGGLFSPAEISDTIASKFMSMLSPTGNTLKALQTPVGSFLLSVTAEVPEDLVQTVIDDVVTGRAGDVQLLAPTGDIGTDMEKLGESFAQNLAFRLAFTPIHAGANSLRQWRAAKKAAKAAGVDNVISDEHFIRNQQAREAADAGNVVDVTKNSATVRNPDGTETVLDNVAMLHFGTDAELQERYPAIAEMLRKKGLIEEDIDVETAKMYDDPDVMVERLTDRTKLPTQEEINDGVPIKKYFEDYDTKRIDDPDVTNKIIDDNIPQRVQFGYYGESGDIIKGWQGREVMAGAALRNPELRNAGLNKAYDVYYRLFPDDERLSFEEWVNTPITLTRRFRAEEGVGSDNANVLGYSMRKDGLAEDAYGPETDTITIEPKYTTGLLMGADDAGFADEGEIFVPTALVEAHPKYMTVEDIVGIKNVENDATMDAAPSSASYSWESPDVTKTYTSAKEVFADRPVGKNMTEVKQWQKNAEAYFMNRYVERAAPAFAEKYPTADEQQQFVRNMDYLFDLQRMDSETLDVKEVAKPLESNTEIDNYGVKIKRVKIGEYDNVPLDFEIADRVAKLNELGYETHNSHSGIGADHQKPSDAGGGYLDFEGSMSPEKKAAIERAAKKAGMGVHESRNPFYLRTDFVVRQSNTADGIKLEDVIEMANAETVSRYGLDPENWVDDASNRGILSEALDYRGEAEKRIYEEHGGYAQPDDASRKESWDTFFRELGVETEPDYEISGSVIGKTYENEGITYIVNEDDVRFYLDTIEPIMKDLREAGAAGQGKEAFTITGYLPHSDYDPTLLTAEDSMQQGVLWREYTGASTTSEDGNFSTGWLNPDLEARYRTFVNNMLWDSLGDEVTVAKYMEEFNADGLDVAANIVEKMVGGRRRLAHLVSESDSVKAVVKNLLGDGELPTEAQLEKAAKDLGSTDIVHDLYRPVYGEAKGLYQTKSAISVKTMAKADWMRSLATGDGTLYDNGGAMIVNGAADAKFLAKRITDAIDNGEKLDVHQMFVEYLMQNQRRTAKGADYIADKWMDKIAQRANNGGISRRALTAELGNLIYGEGANRLFRFIGRMDTSQLTSANKQALDSLLFRHSALSKIKNTSGISANINKWTNRLISARMKSLFWLNYKNGVLQASECIRLFTEFKFGDALSTINKLATDADFRARVDEWVDMLVPERFVKSDSEAATGAMKIIADNSSVKNGELTVNKMSDADMKSLGEKFNEFASAPVELGESMKNRVMMAGILQEAERKGLTGNELFNYVNQRFERVGLAANEMGRLNASDNPLFRLGANLKTFQIRQFRMFLNNIHDMNGTGEASTYIIKNLGWKAGLALIMGKLGYSTAATLGIDPFDLMDDDYTGVDEDNYTGLDYAMLNPVAKLFLSGGFTGYINDAYWAARKAYEDSATVTEQTEGRVDGEFWPGMKIPGITFDNVFNAFSGFIPGFTAGKRVYQMNELMETGWATSATGNKMYQAPTNPLDIATGYVFGRSNTPNARAYYQTPDYLQGFMENGLAGIGQQLGREFGGYRQFDPIDTQNYSDWFNGTAADEQQWNSGYYYFRNKVDNAQNDYQESLKTAYDDKDKQSLLQSFNQKLAEVEDQINRFTAAYEAKHPEGIDAKKMRNLANILNLYQPVVTDTDEEREQRELDANSEALYRYSQAGLPAVTSYSRDRDTGVVEPVYSPQLRSALQGEFGLPEEAAAQIRQLYKDKWKDLGQRYRDRVFDTKGTKNKQAIQKEYISIVRQDLDPIVRLYGNNIWSNEEVENIIDDVFNSMIPKYGQSAKSYLKEVYKNYTGQLRYTEKGNETLTQINKLLDQGKTAQAKALARSLKQRVQENKTSLNREEMEKLQRILND